MQATGNPFTTDKLITMLRNISSGTVRKPADIRETCSFAADRMYELDERIAIMTEPKKITDADVSFPSPVKTLIAVPCGEKADIKFVSCLMALNRVGQTHVNFNIGSLVYDNRNQLVVDAIQNQADVILWLDSDMTFEPDILQRFLADMDENPDIDILCGIFFRRREDTSPVIYSQIEPPEFTDTTVKQNIQIFSGYPRDQLFPVVGCGFGAVLTKTSVCKAVWDKYGPPFAPSHWAGEDLMFCYRARQLGFNIWCDSRVKVGHIGQIVFDEKYWLEHGGAIT